MSLSTRLGCVKKGKNFTRNLEKYSYLRSIASIVKSDIVIFLFDASENISDHDTNIAGFAFEEKKPILMVGNKWDLVKNKTDKTINRKEEEVRSYFKYLNYANIIFISALEKQRVFLISLWLSKRLNAISRNALKPVF
jgi:GTP-binding protein